MIDQRAIIHPTAKIANSVKIGPWTIIGENVVIGEGTDIGPHVVIGENTSIGKNNRIFSFVSIGTEPQYVGYKGDHTRLEIGDENMIREFVTINRGTQEGRGVTRIGHQNYLMAYAHIAHDCIVGNHIVFANLASIAGHVEVGDYANLGAFAGVHQFCRIGAYSFLGRATKIYQDILPYMLVIGNPGVPTGLNTVGLRRQGFTAEVVRSLKRAYQLIHRRDIKLEAICLELAELATRIPEVKPLLDMISTSKRGFSRNHRAADLRSSLNAILPGD